MRLVMLFVVVLLCGLFAFISCAAQQVSVKPTPAIEFVEGPPVADELQVCNFTKSDGPVGKCITLKTLANEMKKQKMRNEGVDESEGDIVDHL